MASHAFWDRLPALFVDPVTGLNPGSERELSACLCLLHDRGKISWDRISLLSSNGSPTDVKAASLFLPDGTMLTEYPLCAREFQDISIWGRCQRISSMFRLTTGAWL